MLTRELCGTWQRTTARRSDRRVAVDEGGLALNPRSSSLLAHPGLVKEGPIQGSRPPAVLVNALKDLRPRLWRECWWPRLQLLHLHAADR